MKVRVVLDANVFVSAVLYPSSNPGHILELVRQNAVRLLVSRDILAEVKAVLSYARNRNPHFMGSVGSSGLLGLMEQVVGQM